MILGTRYGARKDDPAFKGMKAGAIERGMIYLKVTRPRWSDYLKEWSVDYEAYAIPEPCHCCGAPRGAGSLHP